MPGARNYDSDLGIWRSVDPLADKYPGWSPYNYCINNPLNVIDPNSDSTFVLKNNNGTYTVNVGSLSGANDDTGIYIKNADGTVTLVGNSLTPLSFYYEGNFVEGAILDPNSTAGQDFVDGLVGAGPSLFLYMINGTEYGDYDFKNSGYNHRGNMSLLQYRHRGSVAANGSFGSARDFGNIGAGIMAGRSGFSWGLSRIAFDLLESYQQGRPAIENSGTQIAQKIGYIQGVKLWLKDLYIRMNLTK